MTDAVTSTSPEAKAETGMIKWCDMHWADLMFALRDLGLEEMIAHDDEQLVQKLIDGNSDPVMEAFNAVNIGAIEVFGPHKIIEEYGGCPACAFANIAKHAAQQIAPKYIGSPH